MATLAWDDFMGGGGLISEEYDKIDMYPTLMSILFESNNFLGSIPAGPGAKNIEFQHLEDDIVPNYVTAQITIAAGALTQLDFLAADYTQEELDAILRQGTGVAPEALYLQEPNGDWTIKHDGTGQLILGAADGQESEFAVVAGALPTTLAQTKLDLFVALPKDDFTDASPDIPRERDLRRGFTRVFERTVRIGETRKHIEMYGVSDETAHQIEKITRTVQNELAGAVIRDHVRVTGTPPKTLTDKGQRLMTGLLQQIRDPLLSGTLDAGTAIATGAPSSNLIFNAAAATTWNQVYRDGLNDLIYAMDKTGALDAPGADHYIWCHPLQRRLFSHYDASLRRAGYESRKAGYTVEAILTDMGREFGIMTDWHFPTNMILVLDMNRILRRDVPGDGWNMEQMAKTGRSDKWQLSGQFGCSVMNVGKSHGIIKNIGTGLTLPT